MKNVLTMLLLLFSFFGLTTTVSAAGPFQEWDPCLDTITTKSMDPATNREVEKTSKVATLRCVPVVFQNVVTAFLMFTGAVALVLIIYSGIKLVTSGGDPKQVQAARAIMTYAIIGVIVVLSSFAIIYFIGYITNSTDCITDIKKINDGGCR